jgi:hypothetical protein
MQNRKLKKKRRVPVSAQKAALEFASQHLRAAQTQKEVFMWVVMQGDDYDDDEVISRHGTENTPMDAAIALVDEDSTTLNEPAWQHPIADEDGEYIRVRHVFSRAVVGERIDKNAREEIFVPAKASRG